MANLFITEGEVLGHILGLGLSKFAKTKQQTLMPILGESFLKFSPTNAQYFIPQLQKYEMIISSESLTKALETQNYDDWPLVTTIVDIDPDAVFPIVDVLVSEHLTPTSKSDQQIEFLCHLSSAFAKIRDLQGFIQLWEKELKSTNAAKENAWESETLVQHVAQIISENWTIYQINSAIPAEIEKRTRFLPLISMILACSQMSNLLTDQLLQKINKLHKSLLSREFRREINAWRLRYLLLSLDKTIAKSVASSADVDKFTEDLIYPEKKHKDRRIMFFMIQILFRLCEFQPLAKFAEVAEFVLDLVAPSNSAYSIWDGQYQTISKRNIGTAILRSIASRWVVLMENRITQEQIKRLVFAFWAASEKEGNSMIWKTLLENGIIYEQVQLKGLRTHY